MDSDPFNFRHYVDVGKLEEVQEWRNFGVIDIFKMNI